MTENRDAIQREVVNPAVEDARDDRYHRRLRNAAAVAILGIVILATMTWTITASLSSKAGQLEHQVAALQARDDDLQARGNHAAEAAQTLSSQVAKLGGTPAVTAPSPGPSGPTGTPGANGKDGRGVTGTRIDAGHLVIAYTDGTSSDLGRVSGSDGPPGRSITGTSLSGSDLMVAYSDGQHADVGPVVGKDGQAGTAGTAGQNGANGKDGRGVASVTINSTSHLIVTYTDGATEDAGQLPPGPPGPAGPTGQQGPQGRQGPPPAQWTYTDATGRQQSCTRSGGSDAAPAYNCTASTLPKGAVPR